MRHIIRARPSTILISVISRRLIVRTAKIAGITMAAALASARCGSSDPVSPPLGESPLFGRWRYDASFPVPRYRATPDNLVCSIVGSILTLSGHISKENSGLALIFLGTLSSGTVQRTALRAPCRAGKQT